MFKAVILMIYLAVVIAIGIKAKATTLKQFILGDRLNTGILVATIVSTFYGASAILGGVSLTYQLGLGVIWFMVPFYLGNVAVIFLIDKISLSGRYTMPDFLGHFYGREFTIASSVLLAILCLIPEEIIAGGKIISAFTPLSLEAAMVLLTIILVGPIAIGGIKADILTDVIQFALMILMLLLILPTIISYPLPAVFSELPEGYLNPFAYISLEEIIIFFILLFFLPVTSAPLYQRFFASASRTSSRRSVLYSILVWIAVDAIIILSGFIAIRMFPGLEDPDMSLIFIGLRLPDLARGIFFVGLLAVIMSTGGSFIQAGASSMVYDVFRQLKPEIGEKKLLGFSRLFVLVLGIMSLGLALWFRMIVPALLFTLKVWIAGILIPTLAALAGIKLSRATAFYCLAGGALACLVWKALKPLPIDALFVGLGFSLLIVMGRKIFGITGHRGETER